MKKITHKIGILGFAILSLSSLTVLNSCSPEDDTTITDPRRFTADDVRSYEDLFTVFWKTMDQQYNYFYEQKLQGDMDWDEVYRTYQPKFAAIKTYGRPGEDDGQIYEDYLTASKYFEEIIHPFIDRHFYVTIKFPFTNKNIILPVTFYGGMSDTEIPRTYPVDKKYAYMQNKIAADAFKYNTNKLGVIAGSLASDPDVHYFTFGQFSMSSALKITLADNYLNPSPGNALLLTPEILNNNETLNAIEDVEMRKAILDITIGILNKYNNYSQSEVFKTYMQHVALFNQTEIVTDELVDSALKAYNAYTALPKYNTAGAYAPYFNATTANYVNHFLSLMSDNVTFGYNFPEFVDGLAQVVNRAPFYQKFLNPLHKGEIKKLVIDLRSNGGGSVMDARFISDRFITKESTFAYQRSREGNGRFNYTPWIAATTKPHNFGIPANIPIAILTDKGSASMSEITTLMLKSQGNHVVSIGDYSAGATAGLGTVDDFNGGTRDQIAGGKLTFYMPLLAMKDADGVVIEGVGVKPDILVSPLTDDELLQINSPTFEDRVLNEAINYLKSK